MKYVRLLQQAWPDKVITHVLAFKVFLRLGKYVLCAQALLRASGLDSTSPELHGCIVDFCSLPLSEDLPPIVQEVVQEVRGELLGNHDGVQALNTHYRNECSSAAHAIAGARAWVQIDANSKDDAIAFLTSYGGSLVWSDAVDIHKLTASWVGDDDSRVQEYYKACAERFPLSTYFNPSPAENSA